MVFGSTERDLHEYSETLNESPDSFENRIIQCNELPPSDFLKPLVCFFQQVLVVYTDKHGRKYCQTYYGAGMC